MGSRYGRYTKEIPTYIYFVGEGNRIRGPYIHPQKGKPNRKFKISEVPIYAPSNKNKK